MPTTTQVTPGDLITAELMNEILSRLASHDVLIGQMGGAGSTTVVVPTVYGRTLTDARTILVAPSQQLGVGTLIDTDGNFVNPNAQGAGLRMVVGQTPQPGTRVAPQSSVDLLIAAVAGSGGSNQPSSPSISQITPGSQAVNGTVTIFGSNFAPLHTANNVRFNGVSGTVLAANSNTQQLSVVIPSGVPNAPSTPGMPALANVQVSVTTSAGTGTAPNPITITAPVPSTPTISEALPQPAVVGNPLVITGTNFGSSPAQITVTIGGVAAAVTGVTTSTINVTVPMISGLNNIPSTRSNVPLVVTASGVASNAFPITVARLT